MNIVIFITISIFFLLLQVILGKLKVVSSVKRKQKIYKTLSKNSSKKSESGLEESLAKINAKIQKTRVGKKFEEITSHYILPSGFNLTNLLLITAGLVWIGTSLAGLIEMNVILLIGAILAVESTGIIFMISRRNVTKEFDKGYPQLLELLANMYKVQPDLKLAIHRSASAVENKITHSFLTQINKLTQVGVQVTDAFEIASKKIHYHPLEMFISSIKLHQQNGGDLSKLFAQTSVATRKRQESERLIKSTLFQNKVSSVTISVLVPVLFVIAIGVSSNYRTVIFTDPLARTLTVFSFIWWAIGVFAMSRVMEAKF
jgi:Flp pilus assembly protein TadB